MALSVIEIEVGARVCDYWVLDKMGAPVKAKHNPRLGLISKVVYNDGTPEGTTSPGNDVREIWVRFDDKPGTPEKIANQCLILNRRADQTTQFEMKNNGLVQDSRQMR